MEQEHIKNSQLAALYASGVTLGQIRELKDQVRDEKLPKAEMVPIEVPAHLYVCVQQYLAKLMAEQTKSSDQ